MTRIALNPSGRPVKFRLPGWDAFPAVLAASFCLLLAPAANADQSRSADVPVLQFGLDAAEGLRHGTPFSSNLTRPFESPPPRDFVAEFLRRARFITLTRLNEDLCGENLRRLGQDGYFYRRYGVGSREDAMFFAGAYYFIHRTPVFTGGGNSGCTLANNAIAEVMGGFDFSFRTVYSAEMHYRYYLRNYPDGRYILPAMLGIAKCRAWQGDWLEVYQTYKYAMMTELDRYGVDEPDETAGRVASQLTAICEKHGVDFDVKMRIERGPIEPGCRNILESRVVYRARKAWVQIRITCS